LLQKLLIAQRKIYTDSCITNKLIPQVEFLVLLGQRRWAVYGAAAAVMASWPHVAAYGGRERWWPLLWRLVAVGADVLFQE
jgi:hypothetical protein